VCDVADCVQIRSRLWISNKLLRRFSPRAGEKHRVLFDRTSERRADTKLGYFDGFSVDKNVSRAQVAMKDISLVKRRNAGGEPLQEWNGLLWRHPAIPPNDAEDGLARRELHRVPGVCVVRTLSHDSDDCQSIADERRVQGDDTLQRVADLRGVWEMRHAKCELQLRNRIARTVELAESTVDAEAFDETVSASERAIGRRHGANLIGELNWTIESFMVRRSSVLSLQLRVHQCAH
jgi:hypothetical protein